MSKLLSILSWLLRAMLFLALFLFAIKNTDTVTLRFWFDQTWQAPLVLLLLAFLAGGALLGVLACLARMFRQRREIARLKRELRLRAQERPVMPPPDAA
jgi:uncharacterized integral membrane protein